MFFVQQSNLFLVPSIPIGAMGINVGYFPTSARHVLKSKQCAEKFQVCSFLLLRILSICVAALQRVSADDW